MRKQLLPIILIAVSFLFACESSREKKEEMVILNEPETDSIAVERPEISFYFYEEKNDYPDAVIEMYSPLGNQKFRPGKIPFEFNIKNYPFESGMAGFQLKMILNSGDPVGYNSPIFQRELNEGTYRAVGYLVDEEGLALKEFGNFVDRDFMVGETRPFPYQAEPYLALNIPSNNTKFKEGEEVTIDFLLVGGDINLDRLKVQISLNEFQYEIQEVTPVRVANLPKGEYQLTLNLVRRDGKELDGPFSSIRKTLFIE
ncbi:hypothetical protein A33Q_2343 [Indibacter alkaliphilus LW1]|jgi:hypothetical protein|uniref:Uncharacterized protein n=1 Tax=Indibacter alkaliphilus (strain CCUG 57479 / KCTC 22604 / LW1) TaxID=1189612 RepID=S2E377_INDAL|nr:hypothetical protein [Indibacter alkaliphilus]EOZ96573.1 hypothetical protein A33Q_2343 [Indibacter alkaliphilus LW1]